MTAVDYLPALRRQDDLLASTAEGHLDRAVPSCPGWQLGDLVWHVGIVHMFWTMVATGDLSGPDAWAEPDRPDRGHLITWFRAAVDRSGTVLDGLDPDNPAWTWGRQQNVRFIRRRLVQETAVHLWDAVNAVGRDEPIDHSVAADGIDEFVDEVLPHLSQDLGGPPQTICLRARDAGDWTVVSGDGSFTATRALTDAVVSGTASDLLLLLWGRRTPEQLAVDGDTVALQRFLARGRV